MIKTRAQEEMMADRLGRYYSGKKVLITGGLGFIGSTLARRLVASRAQVLLVDSLVPSCGGDLYNIHGLEKRLTVKIADLLEGPVMEDLVRGQDYLFNLAGQGSHRDSMEDPRSDLEINCKSQISILEACRKKNKKIRIVHASTRQVYGKPRYLPVNEDHPLQPIDINGIHRIAGESYHRLYREVYGLRTIALRLTNTYGPRMRIRDARQTFVGWWIRQVLEGKKIEIFGDGKQLRDLNYVDDVVEALILAALRKENDWRIYNLGGSPTVSLKDLAALIVRLNPGARSGFVHFPAGRRIIDIGDYCGDHRRISADLGWQPRIPLQEGLKRTFSYFRLHRRHYL